MKNIGHAKIETREYGFPSLIVFVILFLIFVCSVFVCVWITFKKAKKLRSKKIYRIVMEPSYSSSRHTRQQKCFKTHDILSKSCMKNKNTVKKRNCDTQNDDNDDVSFLLRLEEDITDQDVENHFTLNKISAHEYKMSGPAMRLHCTSTESARPIDQHLDMLDKKIENEVENGIFFISDDEDNANIVIKKK